MTSARPAAISRSGRVLRVSVSMMTARGLVEGADHVLAEGVIDAGLAADGGIDLGQQGGGDLDEGDAALVAGGGKAGHVAHHATAQGDEGAIPAEAVTQQAVEDAVPDLQGFVLLAIREYDLRHLIAGQGLGDLGQIEGGDRLVGDDHDLAATDMGLIPAWIGQQLLADVDGIGAITQGHLDASGHDNSVSRRRRISLTTEAVPRFSVETTRSATWR